MGTILYKLKKLLGLIDDQLSSAQLRNDVDPHKAIPAFHEGGHAFLAQLMGWRAKSIQLTPYDHYRFSGNIQYDLGKDKPFLDSIENYVNNPVQIQQLDQGSLIHLVGLVKKRYRVALAGPIAENILKKNSKMQIGSSYLGSPDEEMANLHIRFLTLTGHYPQDYHEQVQREIIAVFRIEQNWNCLVKLTELILSKSDLSIGDQEIGAILSKAKNF